MHELVHICTYMKHIHIYIYTHVMYTCQLLHPDHPVYIYMPICICIPIHCGLFFN